MVCTVHTYTVCTVWTYNVCAYNMFRDGVSCNGGNRSVEDIVPVYTRPTVYPGMYGRYSGCKTQEIEDSSHNYVPFPRGPRILHTGYGILGMKYCLCGCMFG